MMHGATINGLILPTLFIEMIQSGRWRHPGDEVVRQAIPFVTCPLYFLTTIRELRTTDCFTSIDEHPCLAEVYHVVRGNGKPTHLPLLDIELALLIAIADSPGEEAEVALDYRTNEPRVVASDFAAGYIWREVSPNFGGFVDLLGL